MTRSFKAPRFNLRDPRVAMRILIGVLLAANLVAAVLAFKPFGGSAEDLLRERDGLQTSLTQARNTLKLNNALANKVSLARGAGDDFMGKYLLDSRTAALVMDEEMHRISTVAGIKAGMQQYNYDPIEGSDSLVMMTVSQGFEGAYPSLTKLVNLIDRSPKFIIIDSLQATAPQGQGGKVVNATLKIKVFVRQQGPLPASTADVAAVTPAAGEAAQ